MIYCDTDSIFSYKEFPCSNELGLLKNEGHVSEGTFLYPKAYNIILDGETKIKWKGIPKDMLEMFWKQGFTVEFQKILRLKEALIRNKTPNELVIMEKSLQNISDKRIFPTEIDYLREHRYGKPIYI